MRKCTLQALWLRVVRGPLAPWLLGGRAGAPNPPRSATSRPCGPHCSVPKCSPRWGRARSHPWIAPSTASTGLGSCKPCQNPAEYRRQPPDHPGHRQTRSTRSRYCPHRPHLPPHPSDSCSNCDYSDSKSEFDAVEVAVVAVNSDCSSACP